MSCALIDCEGKRHQLQDDLESFIYVVLYLAFRYLQTPSTKDTLRKFMDGIFNNPEAGPAKYTFFIRRTTIHNFRVAFSTSPPMLAWYRTASKYAAEWLLSDYSQMASNDSNDGKLEFVNPGKVPSTIMFHDHHALLALWEDQLKEEAWKYLEEDGAPEDVGAFDHLPGFDTYTSIHNPVFRASHSEIFQSPSASGSGPGVMGSGNKRKATTNVNEPDSRPQRMTRPRTWAQVEAWRDAEERTEGIVDGEELFVRVLMPQPKKAVTYS